MSLDAPPSPSWRPMEPTCFIDALLVRKRYLPLDATMPFSRYDVDPEMMEAMRAAFYRVCDILLLWGDREDPLTEIVVLKIVELAKAGERDPEILCIDVLAELGTPSQGLTLDAPPERAPLPVTSVAAE